MSRRLLLLLDQHGMTVHDASQARSPAQAYFPASEEGVSDFALFLQQHLPHALQLLLDLSCEQNVLESLPPLRGQARQSLIQRRLQQHFPDTVLHLAESLGRDADSGKERIRLSAFTRHESIARWLYLMEQHACLLQGIYSVSQLDGLLPQRLGQNLKTGLLFTASEETLRQTFILAGQTAFQRRIPWHANGTEEFRREADTLRQYLINQHLIARDTHLPVYVLGATAPAQPEENLTFLTTKQPLPTLYRECLAGKTPRHDFARPEQKKAYGEARQRRLLNMLSLLCLSLSLPLAAFIHGETQSMTEALARHAAQAPTNGPPAKAALPISLSEARALIAQYTALEARRHTPQAALQHLAKSMDRHPAIHLDTLEWRNETEYEALRLEGSLAPAAQADIDAALAQFKADLQVDRKLRIREQGAPTTPSSATHGKTESPPPERHFRLDLEYLR